MPTTSAVIQRINEQVRNDASNFREDVTVNAVINSSDVSTVKLKSGTALP